MIQEQRSLGLQIVLQAVVLARDEKSRQLIDFLLDPDLYDDSLGQTVGDDSFIVE